MCNVYCRFVSNFGSHKHAGVLALRHLNLAYVRFVIAAEFGDKNVFYVKVNVNLGYLVPYTSYLI